MPEKFAQALHDELNGKDAAVELEGRKIVVKPFNPQNLPLLRQVKRVLEERRIPIGQEYPQFELIARKGKIPELQISHTSTKLLRAVHEKFVEISQASRPKPYGHGNEGPDPKQKSY